MPSNTPQPLGRSHLPQATCTATGIIACLLCLAAIACACSVPVFRYALERWPADPFEALIYYRGSIPDAEAQLIAAVEKSNTANLNFRAIDLDTETDPELIELWEDEESDTLPWLVLTYPSAYPYLGPVTSGKITTDVLTSLSLSPMRQRIADDLIAGETAVWILLESGDQEKDDAAASALESRLAHLASNLELPTLEQEDIDAGLVSVSQDELKVAFSMLRLSRENSSESVLIEMLLDSEEDLSDQDAPIVFPVFGRGRILYALVGDGINAGTIDQAAEYIAGACSCQVKEQNPGVDLLIARDWDTAIGTSQIAERELPPLEGAGILLHDDSSSNVVADTAPISTLTDKAKVRSAYWRGIASIVTLVIFVLIAGTLFILNRNSPKS
ncbi:MAG: hypothetical protein ACI9R3_003720 [Verrucomicrobiales bacterium]|jgi:hypothetical protein